MKKSENNFAYIDGANLHRGIAGFGWQKEVIYDGNGKPKGNCDADLVLQAARDTYENKFKNLNDQKRILQAQKEKAPGADGTVQGSSS